MESKVTQALHFQRDLYSYAFSRQLAIMGGRYEDAMRFHFLWLSDADDYVHLVRSMTKEEELEFVMAKNCYN